MLECLEKYSHHHNKADGVVIWLHGLGADCNDFVSIIPELRLSRNIKFIFPNAPMQPVTVNNGYVMRAWYDIYDLNKITQENTDITGINTSVAAIEAIIEKQIALGFTPQQIVVAGFSQGGVISYNVGLKNTYKLAGIAALSCYLPNADAILSDSNVSTATPPIFAAHGSLDQVVPYSAGLLAYQQLYNAGIPISWHIYQMPHSVCAEEITDLSKWLEDVLSA